MVEDAESDLLVSFRLQEGEAVVFNQRRMLHGRRAFTDEVSSTRHLQGCYVCIDEFINAYRVAKRKLEGAEGMVGTSASGNQSM